MHKTTILLSTKAMTFGSFIGRWIGREEQTKSMEHYHLWYDFNFEMLVFVKTLIGIIVVVWGRWRWDWWAIGVVWKRVYV